jgi:type IV pilus assembly protein PilQ
MEMRLRQLLGIGLMLAICGAIAAAASPELKSINVASHGTTTTLTLVVPGSFGHNEYKASENLRLVDLTGVSAGKLRDTVHKLDAAGVESYHVVAYKGMRSVDVARIEFKVTPGAEMRTAQTSAGLQVTITAKDMPAPAKAPAEPVKVAANRTQAAVKVAPRPASVHRAVGIRSVGLIRGKNGLEIEVAGSGPMTAKVLKLAAPDRIVLDIPNALPEGASASTLVNSAEVKGIRTARHQANPPVTRVVVDLFSAHNYELNAAGNKLLLTLLPAQNRTDAVLHPAAAAPVMRAASAMPAMPTTAIPATAFEQSVPAKASDAQPNVTPELRTASETNSEPKRVVFLDPKYETEQNSDPNSVSNKKPAGELLASNAAPQGTQNNSQVAAQQSSSVSTPVSSNNPAPTGRKPVYTGEPISVNLKDVDLKDFFRLIHEVSGLNVVLDPGVHGTLTLVLEDVPWDQALDIVLKNNGLDRQLDGNVLRIATIDDMRKEAQAKRLQVEAEQLAVPKVSVTRFLSYAHAKDVVPTVKKLLSPRGDIISDDRMNALIIQDIPNVIPDIDRLIAELDQKTKEVDIEARVVASTRTFKRDIGTQLGIGWGNGPTAIGGANATGSSPLGGNATAPKYMLSPGGTGQSIPLISNFLPTSPGTGISLINATNSYRVDLILAAAESRGLLKVLSRPHIVTQNNIQAIVKQGMRIPVTTLSQLNGPPTVTYIEAVLRLTVTPQITNNNTIFLNLDIENTTPDFSNVVLNNPVFMTQQATTQVLVSDGGTVMIGGVIQTQNSVTTQQTPLIGDIPVLGNLFKRRTVNNTTQELIFIITPKIIQS